MISTPALVCNDYVSHHSIAVTTTANDGTTWLHAGDCYQMTTGENITLKVAAKYRVDAHVEGSPYAGSSKIGGNKLRQPGTYSLAKHNHGATVLVRVY